MSTILLFLPSSKYTHLHKLNPSKHSGLWQSAIQLKYCQASHFPQKLAGDDGSLKKYCICTGSHKLGLESFGFPPIQLATFNIGFATHFLPAAARPLVTVISRPSHSGQWWHDLCVFFQVAQWHPLKSI